jgi:hypothetical protein
MINWLNVPKDLKLPKFTTQDHQYIDKWAKTILPLLCNMRDDKSYYPEGNKSHNYLESYKWNMIQGKPANDLR